MKSVQNIGIILMCFSLFVSPDTNAQAVTSPLSSGNWVKIPVTENGIYRIDSELLGEMGFNVGSADPRKFTLHGNGGKQLNQTIDIDRLMGLEELPIYIEGEDDGVFNSGDYILFYGEEPHSLELDETGEFSLVQNRYSDTTFYFLGLTENDGKRIVNAPSPGMGFPVINTYDYGAYRADDLYNKLKSGREWFGDMFSSAANIRNYDWEIEGIVQNSSIRVNSRVMAHSFDPTLFQVSVNDFILGNIPVESVSDFTYDEKGIIKQEVFSINYDLVNTSSISVKLAFDPAESSRISEGYLDELVIQVERRLRYQGASEIFQSFESLDYAISQFEISNGNSNLMIWDITDRTAIGLQDFELDGGKVVFAAETDILKKFVVFDPQNDVMEVSSYHEVENQDVSGESVPDLIILTYEGFKSPAEDLASFREFNDGLDVLVLNVNEVFNEFGSGSPDPSAIRNMAAYFYHRTDAPGKLQSLLLMGRGSFDAKDVQNDGLNFIPIYESRESLDPLRTYGSDDYYGILDDGEGEWMENGAGDHDLDIGVGRLPVKSLQEANTVVSKLIHYASSQEGFGNWRNKVLFIADDGDFNIHQDQSHQLSVMVDTTFNRYDPIQLFLDNFDQEPSAGGEKSRGMKEAIKRGVEDGALIVNFTGHGGEGGWAQESILDQFDVLEWNNPDRLALFVTATCEFGRHDNPDRISAGELTILNPQGGAIGLVTTSRPVFSNTNFQLNKAFYRQVFEDSENGGLSLGEIFRRTKNESLSGVSNRNFSLLGDPSMKLNYPKHQLVLTRINETLPTQPDTLAALSAVYLEGEVRNGLGDLVPSFNGEVSVTVYDKQGSVTTLGDESNPYTYKDWTTRLFSGKATVEGGKFHIEFILPKNIFYTLGRGKVSMYALDPATGVDAVGTDLNLVIGGAEPDPGSDTSPPQIELFINDESFLDGGISTENPRLIVKLFDESGINISGIGVGQNLEARLDEGQVIVLNEYYNAEKDDFRYGIANYDFFGLSAGIHRIEVTAWDTYNNFNKAEIQFDVSQGDGFISKLKGSPNPFVENTVISVEHNRPGHTLEAHLEILNMQGKVVRREDFRIENAPTRIELLDWRGDNAGNNKIEKGIYIAVVSVRSLDDGTKNKSYFKLINMN